MSAENDTLDDFFASYHEVTAFETAYGNIDAADIVAVEDLVELLGFFVAGEEYAVDIRDIEEIIKTPVITRVPRTDSSVLGVMSLRGTIVPILDLRRVLAMEELEATRASRVLVVRGNGEPVGLVVDRVTSVVRLNKDAIESIPAVSRVQHGELLSGVGRDSDRLLIVLNVMQVLALLETSSAG